MCGWTIGAEGSDVSSGSQITMRAVVQAIRTGLQNGMNRAAMAPERMGARMANPCDAVHGIGPGAVTEELLTELFSHNIVFLSDQYETGRS